MDFDTPTRQHSERTDSSISTALSGSSYPSPLRLELVRDGSNEPTYKICEEPARTGITSKRGRYSRFLNWRILLSPLRSILDKGPTIKAGETRSLSERAGNPAIFPPRHPDDLNESKPDHPLRARSRSPNDSVYTLPSPVYADGRQLASSPGPLDSRQEVEITAGGTQFDRDGASQSASHSPSAISPGGDSLPQSHLNLPGRCVVADLALLHISRKEADLRDTFARSGYEGSYLIQVGFNQEMLGLNQGLLQEIYLFLDCEVHPSRAENIAEILDPFPVTIYMPGAVQHYPLLKDEDAWDLWTLHGIFCSELRDYKMAETLAPSDATDNPAGSSNNGTGAGERSGDSGACRGNLGTACGNRNGIHREGSEGWNGDDEDEDGGAGDHTDIRIETHSVRYRGTREVFIPFSSTLTLSGGAKQPFTRYNTNACIDIKIEDNPDSQSRPPGLGWGGPWLQASFSMLNAEMHVTPRGKLGYHLGLSQVRMMATGSNVSYLNYSPKIIRVDADDVRTAAERERTLGVRATFSAAPSVRVDGSTSQTFSEERSQNRWAVTSHCLPSNADGGGERGKAIMWKYAHNDQCYTPETQNDFEPKPSAIFGLSRFSNTVPRLEIDVVMDYSWSAPAQTFRDWIADTTRSRSKKSLPAFSNFLHQVSVAADLEHVRERSEWAAGLDAEDRCDVSQISRELDPILMALENRVGASNCEVLLRRALHGYVHLTEEQRREHRCSPYPWPLAQNAGDTLGVGGLPTPSPSPIPPEINVT